MRESVAHELEDPPALSSGAHRALAAVRLHLFASAAEPPAQHGGASPWRGGRPVEVEREVAGRGCRRCVERPAQDRVASSRLPWRRGDGGSSSQPTTATLHEVSGVVGQPPPLVCRTSAAAREAGGPTPTCASPSGVRSRRAQAKSRGRARALVSRVNLGTRQLERAEIEFPPGARSARCARTRGRMTPAEAPRQGAEQPLGLPRATRRSPKAGPPPRPRQRLD